MKNIIKICLAGLLLLGIATTGDPILEKPRAVSSMDAVEKKGAAPPAVGGLADHLKDATGYGDIIDIMRALKSGNRPPLLRTGSGGDTPPPPDSGSVMDLDFTADEKANTPSLAMQFQPCAAMGTDGTIYVVWADKDLDDNYSIYCSKSMDDGSTFITGRRIAGPSVNPMNRPRVAVVGTGSSAKVYVTYTYYANSDNNDLDVYLKYSTDGGITFPNTVSINTDSYYSDFSDVCVDAAGYVYVAYTYAHWDGGGCDDEDVDVEISLAVSYNGGVSWRSSRYVCSDSRDEVLPTLAVFGSGNSSTLHLGYTYDFESGTGEDYDTRYKRITNAGSTSPSIGPSVGLSSSSYEEYIAPGGIAVTSDGNPHIVYTRNNDIYLRRSTDGGASFLSAVGVSTYPSDEADASLMIDGADNPVVAWRDQRRGHRDIYLGFSNDGGNSFEDAVLVNRDEGTTEQYWPSIAGYCPPWKRNVAVVWWDERWDDGDIVYNGNTQTGVRLNVTVNPDYPPWSPITFFYYNYDEEAEIEFTTAGTYGIFYDDEYSSSPLLEQFWSGSTPYERWACPTPPGWDVIPYIYLSPPDSGGEYDLPYWHQYNVTFWPLMGNDERCEGIMPDLDLIYQRYGEMIERLTNDSYPRTDWVDQNTDYTLTGSIPLDPHIRWLGVSSDTLGTIVDSDTIRPVYYLQYLPRIFLTGPSSGNTVCLESYEFLGEDSSYCGEYGAWEKWVDCGSDLKFSDTTTLGWSAVDPNSFVPTEYFSATIRYRNEEIIVIKNDFPEGGHFNADGYTYESPDTFLWGPATTHTIGAISPQTFGDTVTYEFSHWSDSGSIIHDITVPEHAINLTAFFDASYYLTLDYGGSTGGHVPVLTGEGWYEGGTEAPITATFGYDSLAGIRYGFSHWESVPPGAVFDDPTSPTTTILMARPYTAVAIYNVQYSLDVTSTYGPPDPPSGRNWFDIGSEITIYSGTPDVVEHMYCTGFTGTGAVPSSGFFTDITITLDEPSSVTWLWDDQPWLHVTSTYGVPDPPRGITYYTPGTFVEASVPSPFYFGPSSRYVCTGFDGTGAVGSGSTPYAGFVIEETCSITWNWRQEYSFTVNNPGGYDSPNPSVGTHWFPSGSTVNAWVTSPTGSMVCIGFSGTGSVPSYGPTDSIGITLSSPSSITWNWTTFTETVYLDVYSDYGDPSPLGRTYYIPGTMIECSVTTPYYPPDAEEGWRYGVGTYAGTGSAPSGSGSSTGSWAIWSNSSLTWNWNEELRLTIASDPPGIDSPDPEYGEHWYPSASLVTGHVDETYDTFNCAGYVGTGSAVSDDENTFSFTIDEPSSVTWIWNSGIVHLNVISEHDRCTPTVGSHTYPSGTAILAECDTAFYISPTERYKCTGYRGTGGVPSGAGNSVIFEMITSGTLEWIWQHQFRFDVANPDGHGTPTPDVGQHWYSTGTYITGRIFPNPDGEYYCVGYDGFGSLPSAMGLDEFGFEISEYSGIEWNWLHSSEIADLTVTCDMTEPWPPVGTHHFPIGSTVNCSIDSTLIYPAPDNRWSYLQAFGLGSAPTTTDSIFSFVITENSTIDWQWQHDFQLEILNPEGFGEPDPREGIHWIAESTYVTASCSESDGDMVLIGYHATGSIDDDLGSIVNFTMWTPTTIQWYWDEIDNTRSLEVVSDHDSPYPSVGRHYVPIGTLIEATVDSFDHSRSGYRYENTGYLGTGSVPPSGDSSWCDFHVLENSSITWGWEEDFWLHMLYFNTGDAVPDQSGSEWVNSGATADIWTDPDVYDSESGNHYGFMRWQVLPSGTLPGDPFRAATTMHMVAPCTLIALYNIALPCTIRVDSTYDWAEIAVDGVWHETHELVVWWGSGSMHEIEVLASHEETEQRFIFDSWSDGGEISHTVGPITSTNTWTASYRHQIGITLMKEPRQARGFFIVDTDTFYRVDSVTTWLDAGETPMICASSPDGWTDHRYLFQSWSDGGARCHTLDPVSSPVVLTASYSDQFRLYVHKNPVEYYGWISIDDTTHYSTAEFIGWYDRGEVVDIEISAIDVGTDSIWAFVNWNDDPSDTFTSKSVVMDTSFNHEANYMSELYILEYSTADSIWDLDSIDTHTWRHMEPDEAIRILNSSSIPIDWGLSVVDTICPWISGCINGMDRFVLQARIEHIDSLPTTFSYSHDCVKPSMSWSTSAVFGTGGSNVWPRTYQHIWLRFQSPFIASSYETEERIILKVYARPHSY